MVRKEYDAGMLQRVDGMKFSQVLQLNLGDISPRLMRAK